MMMPGAKEWKSGTGLPAGGFLDLGSAKNMSRIQYLKKNKRIRDVFRIAEVQSIQQFGIIWNGDQKNKSF